MKVYMDACCVNRMTDDQSQQRIRNEAEAIERILRGVREGTCQWVGSEALVYEIERNPDRTRLLENRALLALSIGQVEATDEVLDRARRLEAAGYGAFDAVHLASAEAAGADVLLTTDDRFIARAYRGDGFPRIPVRNPVSWLEEASL